MADNPIKYIEGTTVPIANAWERFSQHIKLHERLLIVILGVVMVLHLGNWYLNHEVNSDKAKNAVLTQQLLDVKQEADAATKAAQASQQQYQAVLEQITKQNQQLAAAVAQRNINLSKQQVIDQTLPLPDLANRWIDLAKLKPMDIKATPDGIAVNDEGARDTVHELEKVPVLTQNLQAVQDIADNREKALDKANDTVLSLNGQITAIRAEESKAGEKCENDKKTLKDEARKSKRNWFVGGLVTGSVSAIALLARIGVL